MILISYKMKVQVFISPCRTEFVSAPGVGAYYDDNAEWSHWSPWSQSTSASVQQTQAIPKKTVKFATSRYLYLTLT